MGECKHETMAWVGNLVGCADCKTPAGVVIADLRRQIQEAQGLLISHAPDGHQYTNEQFVNMRYRAEAAETRLASIETDRDQLRDQLAEANEETSTLQTRLAAVEGALEQIREYAKKNVLPTKQTPWDAVWIIIDKALAPPCRYAQNLQ